MPTLLPGILPTNEFLCPVLTYIDVSATNAGVPEDFSFYLVSIANCSSGFGRYFAGLLGDRIGWSCLLPDSLLF